MSSLWHELRSKNIGGSEIADLYGEGYNTHYKLWCIKKGLIEPDDLSGDEHIMSGNWLEGGIMDWANHKWGMNFVKPNAYYQHPSVAGMGCTPDGIDERDKAMAQIKIVSEAEFKKNWSCVGDEISDAPLKFQLQVQHEMACAGYDESHLIVMVVGFSRRLCRMICYRDDALVSNIEERVTQFWQSIEANDPPPANFEEDGDAILAVRKLLPFVEAVDMSGNNFLYDAAHRYLEAKAEEDNASDRKSAAKNEIMQIVGNTKRVVCGDVNITLVEVKPSEGKLVTPDMVGTYIGARKGSAYPKVTKTTPAF